MFIPFDKMHDHSRIWIYQANREMNAEEIKEIKKRAEVFVNDWTAHQQTLHASFEILYSIFMIFAVDENHNDASGCSVDKSVHFIGQVENDFQLSLLDRFNIAFKTEEKVQVKSLTDFLKLFKAGTLTDSVPVFNNLVFTKADLKTKWEIPLRESWIAQKV